MVCTAFQIVFYALCYFRGYGAAIAKQIYDLYHGISDNDPRQQLEQAIDKLSRQQIENRLSVIHYIVILVYYF